MLTPTQTGSSFRAIAAGFFVLGWLIPTMFAQFPIISERLAIEEWQITFFILAMAGGAVPSMLLGASLINRYGSRHIALVSYPLFLIFPCIFMLAPTYPTFLMLGFGLGICSGFFDVCANSQGSLLERVTGKNFMTAIHSLFALGVLVGTSLAASAHALSIPMEIFFPALVLCSALLQVKIYQNYLPAEIERAQEAQETAGRHGPIPRISLFLLIALCLLMMLGIEAEASHYDWLTLFFDREFTLGGDELKPAASNLAMVCFSLGLFIARVLGDPVADRIGRPRLLLGGTIFGLIGLAWLILTPSYYQGLIASFCIGFGFAFFFPVFVAAAGRLNGVSPSYGVALVSAMGWASVFIGPPLIGWIEHYYGFRWAYASIVPVAVLVAILGPWVVFKSRPENH